MHTATRDSLQTVKSLYQKVSALKLSEPGRWAAVRERLKTADFGENSNPQFEKAFGTIAFTYLQEKAPGLLPYVVGFQLLDRSEQGRKAIGAFTIKLGNRVIDVPMFFINGELKGHQFMRLRKPELMVPLRESFLDFLFSKLPQDLGDPGGSLQSPSPVRSTPNIQPFAGSRVTKFSVEDLPHAHGWALDDGTFEAYGDMRLSERGLKIGLALLNKQPLPGVNLLDILSGSTELLKTAAKYADEYPSFAAGMKKRHGNDWLQKAATSRITPRNKSVLQLNEVRKLPLLGAKKTATDKLFYRTKFAAIQLAQHVDKQREELDKYGYCVEDYRPVDKLAVAYEIENGKLIFEAPAIPGVYRVAFGIDDIRDAAIFPADHRIDADCDLVIDVAGGIFANGKRDSYVVSHTAESETSRLDKFRKKLPTKNRPDKGDIFIVRLPGDNVAGPFYVTEKLGPHEFKVDSLLDCCGISNVEFHDTNRSSGKIIDRTLMINKDTKVTTFGKLKFDEYDSVDWRDVNARRDDLLDIQHLDLANLRKYANLELKIGTDKYVELNQRRMKLAQARRFLLEVCQLSKTAVDELMAVTGKTRQFIVSRPGISPSLNFHKWAAGYYVPNIEFPQPSDPYAGDSGRYMVEDSDQQISRAEPQPQFMPTPLGEDVPGQLPGSYAGGGVGDDSVMQTDADSDLASLFDVSGLISLIRNSRIDSQIRKTTQTLLRVIDELGTALFMFYAHNDEFESLYGQDGMEDLEAALISSFEGCGDLFITLSRRAADPYPELDIAALPHK